MKSARTVLSELYLDYHNNYLTLEKFAEHNGLFIIQARALISLAKSIYLSEHPEA